MDVDENGQWGAPGKRPLSGHSKDIGARSIK